MKNIFKLLINRILSPFLQFNIKPMNFILSKDERCLVIAPHPDDESIGCGGLLNLYNENCEVLCLTHGLESDVRYNEFSDAMKYAGIQKYSMLNMKDKNIISDFDVFKQIDINSFDYIFIPYIFDQHRDHKAVSVLLSKLLKIKKHPKNLKISFYEVWSTINMPQYFLDISNVVLKKKEMINLHKSQVSSKDYAEKILGLNSYRGLLKNLNAAEVYLILSVDEFQDVVQKMMFDL